MAHLLMFDAELAQRDVGLISDRDHALDGKQLQHSFDEVCADPQLASTRHSIGRRIASAKRMKWKRVP